MKTEPQIQFIAVTPEELANLISESVKTQIQELVNATNNEQQKNNGELLTRRETADFFKVSLVSIHAWTNDGIIKPYKVGNRTYFKKSELMKVVESSNDINNR